ncbi:TonB-dependent receptor plug domain-containing protein [Rudanella paleaurantiibacter]|uniref:TonB-dependent receptor plug domain-containing protein n=1 Tax=Rudanella paleaurantiibacter TaxID=2614655 RepID=A0A7J5TSG7_9BACT|nr:TonB-dependent receptor [Rudanella paleaurantiibacter]KAB7725586.1 TonB-dependent receptor plug domain-containing protein [Rudanella paleaurantiibacter]
MKTILSILCCLCISLSAYAHLGNLTGTVYDQTNNRPLQGVTVRLTGLNRATITNEAGQYRFDNLVASAYKLELSHVGFATQIVDVTVQNDQTTTLRTGMNVAPVALSEVVISSGRPHDQQLISNLDIKLRPITNSQEVLRLVPGLFIGQHAGGGKAEQLFLRGFDLDHGTDIGLTVDGMPVNMVSHAHGQGYADLHFVIPELIEGVDFKKGPYRADKGNFVTAGWADFRTRTTLDRSFVKLEGGQFDTFRAVAGVDLLGKARRSGSNDRRPQSAYLASEYSFSNAYFDSPQRFNRFNLMGKYHGHIGAGTTLTLTGSTFWSRWNHSGQIPDRAVASGQIGFFGAIDPTEGGETDRTNLNAQFLTVTPGNNVFKNSFFYSNYGFELYSNFTFFARDSVNGDQIRQRERRNLFGYTGSYTHETYLGKIRLTTTVGAQYRHDLTGGRVPTELSYTRNRTETLERVQYGDIDELNAALYADEQIQFSDRLTLNAGLRVDYFRNIYTDRLPQPATVGRARQAIVSPKLNLYYTANPRLQLYLNTGKGFHSNDTRVVVPQGGREILPGAYGADAGVIFKPVPRLLVNAAAWYLWLDQEFVYVGDEGVVEPGGRSRRQGVDVSVRYQITNRTNGANLYADLDLNTARPRAVGVESGQNYLPLAPVLTSIGGLSLQTESGFSGSLRYRYMADRPANEDYSIVAKGYFVTDLQANYTRKNYSLGLSVQNLLNTRWKETQFATESRLLNEAAPVNEIHFTPGTPFFARLSLTLFF